MSMTTRNFFNQVQKRDAADAGPKGAGFVETESEGTPSVADGATKQAPASLSIKLQTVAMAESDNPGKASTQSPASLQGNVVETCSGAEGKQS